jgi:hypothetical protein
MSPRKALAKGIKVAHDHEREKGKTKRLETLGDKPKSLKLLHRWTTAHRCYI